MRVKVHVTKNNFIRPIGYKINDRSPKQTIRLLVNRLVVIQITTTYQTNH